MLSLQGTPLVVGVAVWGRPTTNVVQPTNPTSAPALLKTCCCFYIVLYFFIIIIYCNLHCTYPNFGYICTCNNQDKHCRVHKYVISISFNSLNKVPCHIVNCSTGCHQHMQTQCRSCACAHERMQQAPSKSPTHWWNQCLWH